MSSVKFVRKPLPISGEAKCFEVPGLVRVNFSILRPVASFFSRSMLGRHYAAKLQFEQLCYWQLFKWKSTKYFKTIFDKEQPNVFWFQGLTIVHRQLMFY